MTLVHEPLPIRKVYFGDGSTENLGFVLEKEIRNPIIATSRSVSRTIFFDAFSNFVTLTTSKKPEVFNKISQHSPVEEINELIEMIATDDYDGIIAIGGGSVIDSSKIARIRNGKRLPMVAIPTTLSAAEFSHIAGYSEGNVKKGRRGMEYVADFVVLDPSACIETPEQLWRSTGVRSLDHAIEAALDTPDWSPFLWSSKKSIDLLMDFLPKKNIEAIAHCQEASWLSYMNVFNSPMGLSHSIGKVIGARFGIPHGITSCLTLPGVLRYYAKKSPERIYPLTSKFFSDRDAQKSILKFSNMIEDFIDSLGLGKKFADYAVGRQELVSVLSQLNITDSELIDELVGKASGAT